MTDELLLTNNYTLSSIANMWKNTGSKKDLSSKFIVTQNDIQDKLIKVDELYKPLNNFDANSILSQLQKIDMQVQKGKRTWHNYFNGFKEDERWQIDFVKNTDLQTASTEDVIKAQNAARDSDIKYNNSLKQMTLSAKTSAVVIKGLALAGNMIASWAISFIVSKTVEGLYNLANAAENAKENAKELTSSLTDMQNSQNSNSSIIANLNEEYKILSDGVNRLGENVSLTTDEYSRYQEICNQVAGIMPDLVQGYDKHGTAILKVKGNLADLNAEYEKYKQNEAIKAYNDGDIDSVFGTYKNFFNNGSSMPSYEWGVFANYFNTVSSKDQQIDYLGQLTQLSNSDLLKLSERKFSEDNDGYLANILRQYGLDKNSTQKEIDTVRQNIRTDLQRLQTDMDTIMSQISSTSVTYGQMSDNYWDLDSDSQKYFQSLLNGITPEFVKSNNMNTEDGMQNFVNSLISSLKENKDGIDDAFNELFSLDTTDLTPEEIQKKTDSILDVIAQALNLDANGRNQLKIVLNLEDVDNNASKYEDVLRKASEKISGETSLSVIKGSGENYSSVYDNLNKFAEDNSINSEEEINRWETILDEVSKLPDNYDKAAAAKRRYLEPDVTAGETPNLPISNTIDQLNTRLKPTLDSLKAAYQDVFTIKDGKEIFTPENVDLSMLANVQSSIDELNKIDGINIDNSSFENFASVLSNSASSTDDAKNSFSSLANTIIYATDCTNMSSDTFNVLSKSLKSMGIVNADGVLSNIAQAQKEIIAHGYNLADITNEQAEKFINEGKASAIAVEYLKSYMIQKQIASQPLNTLSDVVALESLCNSLGVTGELLEAVVSLKSAMGAVDSGAPIQAFQSQIDSAKAKIAELAANGGSFRFNFNASGPGTSSASSAGQDAANAYLEAFENELSELDTLKDREKITEKQYLDALRKLYVKYYNDKEKYLDQYEKYEYQYLSGMKSLYESAFSYIVKQIDKRIDALRKESESQVANLEAQKKAAEEFYQSQIDDIDDQIESIDKEIAAKQDLIDAINDAAEARKREIDLQKAQYDLERMQNQKTNYVYKDGQMIYEADSTGIRDARENVEDAKREVEIAAVEKVIEGLEKQRDILEEQKEALEQALEASNAYWDAQIEQTEQYFDTLITGMEEYKSRWEELSEIEENAKMNLALEELGITEQDILGMSTEAFNNVKQAYMNILADMYNGNDQLLMQLSALSGIQLSDLTGYLDGTVDALDRLNQMDLEETNKSISGISGSFDSIAASAGSAASAIDGGSGGGDVQNNASGENNTPGNGGGGSGKSILNSIQTLSTEGVDNINKVANAFAGSNEDEQSGVSVASAVQQVIDKVGSEQAKSKNPNSNDTKAPTGKSSDSLMSAIQDQTEAALNEESGIPAQKKAWENLNEPLDKANELILSIKNSLEGMDGKEFSVTLSVHGSSIGTVIKGIMGIAEVEGTALLQGDWGAKESRKSLVGELGQELIVRGSRFFTVGNNGAEMFNVQKGDIIFNHEQTEQLLKHGRISSRGTSYADGTTNTFPDHLTPIDQLSDEYSLFRQFNEYLKKSTDIFSSAGSLHRPLEEIADSVSMIEHTVNNKNMNAMKTFEINIGDINLAGVQDVNSLSAAIVTRLPNLVIQELHRS